MFLMVLGSYLILRKPRSGCLEGRTTLIQPIRQLIHKLESEDDEGIEPMGRPSDP
jgi:hypothetical protein